MERLLCFVCFLLLSTDSECEGLRLQLVILASWEEEVEDNKERRQSWTEYRVTVRVLGCVNLLNTLHHSIQFNRSRAS